MAEFWDVYDTNRKKTGKIVQRGTAPIFGEYHVLVEGVIINSKKEILLSQRAEFKEHGLKWECNGGSILQGETSLDGIIRELREELGLNFSKKEAMYLKEVRRDILPQDFKDLWVFRKDINIEDIKFPDGEAIAAKWVSIEEFEKMRMEEKLNPSTDFGEADFETALNLKPRNAYTYIEKNVKVKIDRPLGSKHPKHGFEYPTNYGYIPNTVSGDGEELDAYVLGIDKPIDDFEGKCIAVIHRLNDDDDKLIVTPNEANHTDEQIRELTHFQEQYFDGEIIR